MKLLLNLILTNQCENEDNFEQSRSSFLRSGLMNENLTPSIDPDSNDELTRSNKYGNTVSIQLDI